MSRLKGGISLRNFNKQKRTKKKETKNNYIYENYEWNAQKSVNNKWKHKSNCTTDRWKMTGESLRYNAN